MPLDFGLCFYCQKKECDCPNDILTATNTIHDLQQEIESLKLQAHYEIEGLVTELERANGLLRSIKDDMLYKPVHFDWPSSAMAWFNKIRDYFAAQTGTGENR